MDNFENSRAERPLDISEEFFRQQWPRVTRVLYKLCMGRADTLLTYLCEGEASQKLTVVEGVERWRDEILRDLEQRANIPGAWKGWREVIPLLGDVQRLGRLIEGVHDDLCRDHKYRGILWNTLRRYFREQADELSPARKTREKVWRKLDQIRNELNKRREQEGKEELCDLPITAAAVFKDIAQHPFKDSPRSVEGVLGYFYEFDPVWSELATFEFQHLNVYSELTETECEVQLIRCLERMPAQLRQAVEVEYGLAEHLSFVREVEFKEHYGFGYAALRKRVREAFKLLRECLGL